MALQNADPRASRPSASEPLVDRACALVRAFCVERLDPEYGELACRILRDADDASAIVRGNDRSWAAGALRLLAHANLLSRDEAPVHIYSADIMAALGVSRATVDAKRQALDAALASDDQRSRYVHSSRASEVAAYLEWAAQLPSPPTDEQLAAELDALDDPFDECPFHDRIPFADPDDPQLDADDRAWVRSVNVTRRALPVDTALGRCLDAALAQHVLAHDALDEQEWGEDERSDTGLIAGSQAEVSDGVVEEFSEIAAARTRASLAWGIDDLVQRLAPVEQWVQVEPRRLHDAPYSGDLPRLPGVDLPGDRCFASFEDDKGHPIMVDWEEAHVALHGAFILRLGPAELAVAPVVSVASRVDTLGTIRLPLPAVSYSDGAPTEAAGWCVRHVDCGHAQVHDAVAEDVCDHSLYGAYVDLSEHLSGCVLVSALRNRKPPPPPPRKRTKRAPRGGRR
jgi:hypothetical protein